MGPGEDGEESTKHLGTSVAMFILQRPLCGERLSNVIKREIQRFCRQLQKFRQVKAAWPSGDRWERRMARGLIKEDASQMPRGPSDSEGAHVSLENREGSGLPASETGSTGG